MIRRGHDTTGDLGLMLVIQTCSGHDVVITQVTLTSSGQTVPSGSRVFGPAWELPIGRARSSKSWPGDWAREITAHQIV